LYVPLGAFNFPGSLLRKIPVSVKPNPEKVVKDQWAGVLDL
jgi:hypothetical protein